MTLERLAKALEILRRPDKRGELCAEHDQIWFWGVREELTEDEHDQLEELGVHWDDGWTAYC